MIGFTDITSYKASFRFYGRGFVYDVSGPAMFNSENDISNNYLLGLLNSKICDEEYLDVQFDFSKGVTIADAKTADELYRSIIEKKPFKRFKTFDTLSGKGHFITASEQGEYINTAIAFEFSESKHISLLNANFTCRAINCIFNAVIASFSANGDEETGDFVIHLTTAPGEKMYESVQYFISEDQLDAFRENKEHITILRDATEISALE